jgi:lipoprotein-anchoring transpeptidase ErfK/SrfK
MKNALVLAACAAMVAFAASPSAASDRYRQPPPLMVSPDLAAPWVVQLQQRPGAARQQPRQGQNFAAQRGMRPVVVEPQPRRQSATREQRRAPLMREREVQTAAIARPDRKPVQPQMNPIFLPQTVAYSGPEKPGTIVIDTRQNFLFLVEVNGQARRYGVGTGKPGFEWAGTHKVTQKREWPDWRPPAEMIAREKAKGRHLPVHMAGGPENPLGARALYLGSTLYRIHGTNQPWTIGGAVSSGCIRMRNEDVIDLYERVGVGTRVVVI